MKGLQFWVVLTLLGLNYLSCTKKDIKPILAAEDPFISEAITYLRNHSSPENFDSIDLEHYQLIRVGETGRLLVRFFARKDFSNSVTLVKTEQGLSGNWLKMEGTGVEENWKSISLEGDKQSSIRIVNRSVVRVDSKENGRERSSILKPGSRNMYVLDKAVAGAKYNPDDETPEWLPEFVVVGYSLKDPTPFFSLFWLTNMNPLFLRSFTPGSIIINPEASGGGGPGAQPKAPEAVEIEVFKFEDLGYGLKLKELFKCFDNIPSDGAKYEISLYSDIPVDDDPSELLNFLSPGHTFLSFTKENSGNAITQVFGFYPNAPTLTVFSQAVESRLVDNGFHEFNVELKMNKLNEIDFKAAENLAIYLADNLSYDLNDFNCTDYALDVFNKARPLSDQIIVPDWHVNYNPLNYGRTPNGLYQVLKEMKNDKGPESEMIRFGNFKASKSQGICK